MNRQILVMLSDRRPSTDAKVAGIYRYAKNTHWKIQVINTPTPRKNIRQLIELWNPDGCIVESGSMGRAPSAGLFAGVRTVFLDADRRHMPKGTPIVIHDSEADGRLAAKELLLIGRTQFAFIGSPDNLFWSREREAAFLKTLRLNGNWKCLRLHPKSTRQDEIGLTNEISEFIRGLPKGCGIFVANDFLANIALIACRLSRRSIPDDIAILSVDNNEALCLHTTPTLSSIAVDFELGGYLAAEMLDTALRQKCPPNSVKTYGPIMPIRRASTSAPPIYSGVTLKIVNVIRDTEGRLAPAEILETLPCSRRTAEQQFKASTGKTILKAVTDMRFKVACQLLRQRQLPLLTIANRVGYRSTAAFDRFFASHAKVSPIQWQILERKTNNLHAGRD